jgi:DNA-binding transcriptional LysR family regulator
MIPSLIPGSCEYATPFAISLNRRTEGGNTQAVTVYTDCVSAGSRIGSVPELRHLRYFIAVAEELNFRRAAERLHMAQPPLSAAIRQLEQELGVELLARTTREVHLTDAGRGFLAGAHRTLAELERAASDAQRAAAGELGRLCVAFSWSARFETLPAIGRAFQATHPDVEVLTESLWNAELAPALRAGKVDVAVALMPDLAAELSYAAVRSEPVVALLGEGHPRAAAGSLVLRDLREDRFLLYPRELGPRLYDFMVGLCRRSGFEPTIAAGSFHSHWELDMLSREDLVALAPASVALDLPDGIAAVLVEDPPDRLDTVLVWRTDDPSAINLRFRQAALGAFAS